MQLTCRLTPQEAACRKVTTQCQVRELRERKVGSQYIIVRGQTSRPLSTGAQELEFRWCTGLVSEAGIPARGNATSTFGR